VNILNGVIIQGFQWNTSNDGNHWNYLASISAELSKSGITAIWLPPPQKSESAINDVGYAPYDLYDLGQYNQKDSARTKYGTQFQFINAVKALKTAGLQVYIDAVLHHRCGADLPPEQCQAIVVSSDNRCQEIPPWYTIKAYTRFDFKGRLSTQQGRKASSKTYSYLDFDAVNVDANNPNEKNKVYKVKDKRFQIAASKNNGIFDDYVIGADHDMDVSEVRDDLFNWGVWILDETDADGFRFDAAGHVRPFFFKDFLGYVRSQRQKSNKEVFAVGEYFEGGSTAPLHEFLMQTSSSMSLFDFPLQAKFHNASISNPKNAFDLRILSYDTLSSQQPTLAVTFVENHDTQPLSAADGCQVADWFKPLAYAYILLREQGYPTIFIADWEGAKYENNKVKVDMPSHKPLLKRMLAARKHYAYGPQLDYIDYRNTIGWTRLGTGNIGSEIPPKPMAVLMTNGYTEGWKWMEVRLGNTPFIDILGNRQETIFTNMHGWGQFTVNAESCSVWVPEEMSDEVRAMI
jgi:alpha-amylase